MALACRRDRLRYRVTQPVRRRSQVKMTRAGFQSARKKGRLCYSGHHELRRLELIRAELVRSSLVGRNKASAGRVLESAGIRTLLRKRSGPCRGFFWLRRYFLCWRALQQRSKLTKVVVIQVGDDPITHAMELGVCRIKTSVSRKSNRTVAVS